MIPTSRGHGRWSNTEDEVLMRETRAQECTETSRDWNAIAAHIPGRSNKDCRKRWLKLNGRTKKGGWSPSEDEQLRNAIKRFGFRWSQVAQFMKTRSADQCASRWRNHLDSNINHSEWTEDEDQCLLNAFRIYGSNWKMIQFLELSSRSTQDIRNRYRCLSRAENHSQTFELLHSLSAITAPSVSGLDLMGDNHDSFLPFLSFESDHDILDTENAPPQLHVQPKILPTGATMSCTNNDGVGDIFGLSATHCITLEEEWGQRRPQDMDTNPFSHPNTDNQPLLNNIPSAVPSNDDCVETSADSEAFNSTLTLEGVHLQTLGSIMKILTASSTSFKIIIDNTDNR